MKQSDKIFLIIAFVFVNLVAVWFVSQMFSIAAAVLAGTLVVVFAGMDISVRMRNKKMEDSKTAQIRKEKEEKQCLREEDRIRTQQKKEEAVKKQRMREHSSYRNKK